MQVRIVAVGRVKEKPERALLKDYYTRIGRYCRFDEVELRDGEPAEVAARFEKAVGDRARSKVVAMEVDGKAWTSRKLGGYLERCQNDGVQRLVFLIGGSYGLPRSTSDAADVKLSLSAMTLPHRLARVLLAEQVYRGFTILRGEPYSH